MIVPVSKSSLIIMGRFINVQTVPHVIKILKIHSVVPPSTINRMEHLLIDTMATTQS